MIPVKSQEEIKIMRQGGKILAKIMKEISSQARPGISTLELDEMAEKLIKEYQVKSAFKGYRPDTAQKTQNSKLKTQNGYPFALCASVNNQVVHGLPSKETILKEGDIIGLDLGIKYQGYYLDMAKTVGIGKISKEAEKLIEITKKALGEAVLKCYQGVYLGDISSTIQNLAEKNGFSVVKSLTGHGVGKSLHEEPSIFNFGKPKTGPKLKKGMVLAIEPMINEGGWEVKVLDDGWTVVTADGRLSAHFEDTILVGDKKGEILTIC